MNQMTLYFAGRVQTFKRPTRKGRREWRHPARDRRLADLDLHYSVTTYPGELVLHENSDNGEGRSYATTIINFDDETMVMIRGGTGCDGHISSTKELDLVDGKWVEESHRCYDQFAQAAGY